MEKPNIKYAKNHLRYIEWKIVNYETKSYEDTLFIIWVFASSVRTVIAFARMVV